MCCCCLLVADYDVVVVVDYNIKCNLMFFNYFLEELTNIKKIQLTENYYFLAYSIRHHVY